MLDFSRGTRVVSINLAMGYFNESKPCAGTVLRELDTDAVEIRWDDGDIAAEFVGDLVTLNITPGDKTFGAWAPGTALA